LQACAAFDGRIDADVLPERGEAEEDLAQAEGWHAMADERLCVRQRVSHGCLNSPQVGPDTRRSGSKVLIV